MTYHVMHGSMLCMHGGIGRVCVTSVEVHGGTCDVSMCSIGK